MPLRVPDAIVDPTVGADALGDGHEVVGASVQVHQVDHVGQRACHSHRVRVGQSVVKVVEELPERLDLEQVNIHVFNKNFLFGVCLACDSKERIVRQKSTKCVNALSQCTFKF